jgi:peptidoglycan-associated lipoprotein
MIVRTIVVAVAVLAGAVPAAAQQRGTVEFGGFASNTSFDHSLGMTDGLGAGGRIGVFIWPRLSLEFEGGGTSSDRPSKVHEVNVGIYSGRVTGVPLKFGRVSFLVGAGMDYIDTWLFESYGVHALLGAKLALTESFALRVDGIESYMGERYLHNDNGTNTAIHVGFSVHRGPRGLNTTNTVTNTVIVPAAGTLRSDAVSAAETRRLRGLEARYVALRDSLGSVEVVPVASAEAVATMRDMIYFDHDRSDLTRAARETLTDKLTVFRDNPTMRISIVGFASQPGTTEYNMALGLRRAQAAKAYLVSQGIDPTRIEIATRGEGQLVVEGPGEAADAQNRRGQFSLLIADVALPKP